MSEIYMQGICKFEKKQAVVVPSDKRFMDALQHDIIYKKATWFYKLLMNIAETFGVKCLSKGGCERNINFEMEMRDILCSFVQGNEELTNCRVKVFDILVTLDIDRQDKGNPKLIFTDIKQHKCEISRDEIMLNVFTESFPECGQPDSKSFAEKYENFESKEFNPGAFSSAFIKDAIGNGISDKLYVSITKNNGHADINYNLRDAHIVHNLRDVPVNELTQIGIQRLVIQNEAEHLEYLNKDKVFHQLIKESNESYHKHINMLNDTNVNKILEKDKITAGYLKEVEEKLGLESGEPESELVEHLLSQAALSYIAETRIFMETAQSRSSGELLPMKSSKSILNDSSDAYMLHFFYNELPSSHEDLIIREDFLRPEVSERHIEIIKGSGKAVDVVCNFTDRFQKGVIYNEETGSFELAPILVHGRVVMSLQENGKIYSSQESCVFKRGSDSDYVFGGRFFKVGLDDDEVGF